MTARSFISLRERPLFKAHARLFLEHVSNGLLNGLKAQNLELGVRWIVLNDTVSILIGEHCKIIFCAQVCLILRSLLLTGESVVFYTQERKTILLKFA
jgi:hypothetical protein